MQFIALCAGACIGAVLRWTFSLLLNPVPGQESLIGFPGTLAANWCGAYCIGLAWSYFSSAQSLSPTVQLFIMTGLLGSLTTFSTFSLEAVDMLMQEKWWQAACTIMLHVSGSLLLTWLGIKSHSWLFTTSVTGG